MDFEDYMQPEVGVAAVVTATLFSPKVRHWLRRGLVYGIAGVYQIGDMATSFARGVKRGASQVSGTTQAGTTENVEGQWPEERGELAKMEKTEQVMDRMGQNVGSFIARTTINCQHAFGSIRNLSLRKQAPEGERAEMQKEAPTGEEFGTQSEGEGKTTTPSPTTKRAEEMVGRLGKRWNQLTILAGFQALRLAARVREEAEDIWAEVQTVRAKKTPQQPSAEGSDRHEEEASQQQV